ncbi:DUF5996 family protein [Variovorax sp. J22R133]|uniref:DUF5996 family protein n=1 Tax=Variovorax brevis TaxID=3053503 RepID=UPI002577016D|nr:DUF5996 family protein [Variovorax sp. J22R133]MDM0114035.1 DUF5996 family protein [Variovorax sp. J22R133]
MAETPLAHAWPTLDYSAWRTTAQTLQLWTQIVGKIRLARSPWINHGWQVPLYLTSRGLGTSTIPDGSDVFEIDFDFIAHRLVCRTSRGGEGAFQLEPMPVAHFYERILRLLSTLGVDVAIHQVPNEVADPIPFPQDFVHADYDAQAAHRFWRALLQADRMLKLFRTCFLGKVSPVHFFWGSFDLAVTRFSGRTAPPHPGTPGLPDRVARDAYSHEVSSAGFWPGGDAFPQAVFYAYAYPEPPGFRDAAMPAGASFEPAMGEYVLPYSAVCAAPDPDKLVFDFLHASYGAAADAAGWDRRALDCSVGVPRVPKVE